MANYVDSQGLPVTRSDIFYQDSQGNMVPVTAANPLPITYGSGGPQNPSYAVLIDGVSARLSSVAQTTAGVNVLVVSTGLPPITSLSAGTSAAGAGTVLDGATAHNSHAMVVTTGSVACTAGTVVLQGSHDNVNWVQLGTFSPTVANTSTVVAGSGAYRYTRADITVALVGGTITATLGMS